MNILPIMILFTFYVEQLTPPLNAVAMTKLFTDFVLCFTRLYTMFFSLYQKIITLCFFISTFISLAEFTVKKLTINSVFINAGVVVLAYRSSLIAISLSYLDL